MNIQQALRKQKEIIEKIGALEGRVQKDFLVTEGRPLYPDQKYQEMLKEIEALREEALGLKLKIDVANRVVVKETSASLLLAKRAKVSNVLSLYQSLKAQDADVYHRYRETLVAGPNRRIPEAELDQKIDGLVEERRRIDDQICELNATVQVV